MNKSILPLILSAALAAAGTFSGVITDSMCLQDHKMMNIKPDAECVRQCAQHDKSVKYVLFDGQKAYKLSDQDAPAKFAARKVRVTGTLFEKTGVLKVDKIEPAR